MKKSKTVAVGLSGGVDSSVAAYLLKKRGFSVVGVFMRFWSEKGENKCCDSKGEEKARRVAGKLDIPFYVINLEEDFKKKIVDSFFSDLKKGETPNPCTLCNREIKLKALFDNLATFGADYVATGHYARLRREIRNPKFEIRKNECKLLKGRDRSKDQSYFLWNLKKEWLSKILFPLGGYKKEEVRDKAKKIKLPTASAQESQEICFIPDDMTSFLKRNIGESPGEIVDTEGKKLGEHKGLFYHTIGQRKGLNLSGGPYYVLEKRKKDNKLVVTKEKRDLFRKELSFKNANFFSKPSFPFRAKAKIRYGERGGGALVEKGKVIFSSPREAVTPGQSVVFYKGEELIGGGVIKF